LFTGSELLDNNPVLIVDEKGTVEEIIRAEEAGEDVQSFTGLLTPGFINAHCHLELSHMKGIISPGSGLVDFLITVIKKRSFPLDVIEEGIINAEKELYGTGTVAIADICNTTHTFFVKQQSKLLWHNFIEVLGFTEQPAERFRFAYNLLKEFTRGEHGHDGTDKRTKTTLAPHAPYSISETMFRLINESLPQITTIHNQESEAENELYISKSGALFRLYEGLGIDAGFFKASGKSSLQTYLPLLDQPSNILLVHNTFTSAEDLFFLKAYNASHLQEFYFVTCLRSNQYIESALPPLMLLRENNMTICLGTDSYASNYSLNLLDEMKAILSAFPSIYLPEVLEWATLNGAKALKLDSLLGSFEKGKSPGIVHISEVKEGRLTSASRSRRII
jgi:cytosine/adenosine deaminase-related metal-dependent hydrolase